MKSRNLKVDDYILEIYKKSRYQEIYNPDMYSINGSNLWLRTKYLDIQPTKYIKNSKRPKKRNLKQEETDESDHKIRIGSIIKYSRCKQTGHKKSNYKMTPNTQENQLTQASQQT